MVHCGAKVFLGSLVFLAMDLRATFFLLYTILVVLSPMEKCISEGDILLGELLLSGKFSESSESICGGAEVGFSSCLYCMSSSSSDFPSSLHISSCDSTSCLRVRLSKQRLFNLWYDKFFYRWFC